MPVHDVTAEYRRQSLSTIDHLLCRVYCTEILPSVFSKTMSHWHLRIMGHGTVHDDRETVHEEGETAHEDRETVHEDGETVDSARGRSDSRQCTRT